MDVTLSGEGDTAGGDGGDNSDIEEVVLEEEDSEVETESSLPAGMDPTVAHLLQSMKEDRARAEKREKAQRRDFEKKLKDMELKLKSSTSGKRSRPGDGEDSEEPVLIDEQIHVKDDAVNTVDLKLRNKPEWSTLRCPRSTQRCC